MNKMGDLYAKVQSKYINKKIKKTKIKIQINWSLLLTLLLFSLIILLFICGISVLFNLQLFAVVSRSAIFKSLVYLTYYYD